MTRLVSGKLAVCGKERLSIERAVAYHLDNLKNRFSSCELADNCVQCKPEPFLTENGHREDIRDQGSDLRQERRRSLRWRENDSGRPLAWMGGVPELE